MADNSMITFLSLLPLIAAIAVGVYTLLNFDRLREQSAHAVKTVLLPEHLTADDIGVIEKDLAKLVRVIVIADHVEPPTDKLRIAVEYNFKRGVTYLFLISHSRVQLELDGYYKIFEALAKIVISRSGMQLHVRDLVDIQQLPYDWNDYPYLFYQVQEMPDTVRTIAFRGEELREGIANTYVRVEGTYAHTIAKSVLADAPRPVEVAVELEQFQDVSGVFPVPSEAQRKKQSVN